MSEKSCPFCNGAAEKTYDGEHVICFHKEDCTMIDFAYGNLPTVDDWNNRACDYADEKCDYAYGNDAEYWHDEYQKLFDAVQVIREATQPTCSIVSSQHYDDYDIYDVVTLSCGHEIQTDGASTVDLNYCPVCGAKVVQE